MQLKKSASLFAATAATLAIATLGVHAADSATPTATTAANKGNPVRLLCDYNHSAANTTPSVNATSIAKWSCSENTRSLVANGLPDHEVGIFPNRNNPPTISAQNVNVSMPLAPVMTAVATRRDSPRAGPGFILNGVKMDPSTAGTCDDSGANCTMARGSGAWSIEAMGQKTFNFGTDSSNAHVQPGGAYHYHGIPEGFVAKLGTGTSMALIGWAADGFPIYARYGFKSPMDASSGTKVVTGSYRLKPTPSAGRPAASAYPMGTFTQDYEYAAGSGDLDECNGRVGVTPEFPGGTYHYYATDTYPYLQRCVKGKL